MSYNNNNNINESPNHFMVLDAIDRRVNSINKIAKVTKLEKANVELITNDLSRQRLIIKAESKGFLGKRKLKTSITETGIRLLNIKKQELEQRWQQIQQWYNNGDRSHLQSFMDYYRAWIPMMLFSGIMNMIFFTSMMSFMGMAMNPIESKLSENNNALIGINNNSDDMEHLISDDSNSDVGSNEFDNSGIDNMRSDFNF
jgi:DNA-binding MarR family transcriptional regulator